MVVWQQCAGGTKRLLSGRYGATIGLMGRKRPTDGKQITLHVDEQMHRRLWAIAERERRSLHAQLLVFRDESITRWEKEHGDAE